MKLRECIFALIYASASLVDVTAGVEDSRLLAPSKKLGDESSVYDLLIDDDGPKMVIKFIVNYGKIQYYTVYQNETAPNFRSISRIVGSEKYEDSVTEVAAAQ